MMRSNDITPDILDDLEKYAEQLKIKGEDLDEAVHDAKGGEAADINNSGLRVQLEYLLQSARDVESFKKWLKAGA
jgi:hypothetical protein